MNGFCYKFLLRMAGLCGPWLLAVTSRIIAAGFFLFSGRVSESRRLYGALFPERGGLYHLWCAFRQYQNFTTIHLDRFLAERSDTTTFTTQGWEKLESVIGKQGGILLMSHLGNWEMAARLLRQQKEDLQLLLYMGVKEKEGVERMQKEDLRRAGVRIIGVDQEGGSPFAAVEGIRFLQSGGIVSMTGDIVWRSDQRKTAIASPCRTPLPSGPTRGRTGIGPLAKRPSSMRICWKRCCGNIPLNGIISSGFSNERHCGQKFSPVPAGAEKSSF